MNGWLPMINDAMSNTEWKCNGENIEAERAKD